MPRENVLDDESDRQRTKTGIALCALNGRMMFSLEMAAY